MTGHTFTFQWTTTGINASVSSGNAKLIRFFPMQEWRKLIPKDWLRRYDDPLTNVKQLLANELFVANNLY